MEKQRKKLLYALSAIFLVPSAFAQGNGTAGINEATQMVTSYFEPATQLIYAIGAVVGLIGGVKVYNKFSSGDPDTSKTAASWFWSVYLLNCSCNDPPFILPLNFVTMNTYHINKGIGRTVEFKGLKAQYLFIFAGYWGYLYA
jgi:hypothetical protein